MKVNITDRLIMILKTLIGLLTGHVHIEPENFLVIGTKDQIVTLRMDRNAGDPLSARLVLLNDRLLLEVVLKDTDLSRCKEVRLSRVESKALNDAFGLRERFL